MNNIYFFSKSHFKIKTTNQIFDINSNSIVKINDIKDTDNITIINQNDTKILSLKNLATCNYYNCWLYNKDTFIEIVATNFDNLIQKINAKDFEILIYENATRIIVNSKCFCHVFKTDDISHAIKKEFNIYIFNSKNLIIFNTKTNSFSYMFVSKFLKNNQNVELLCKTPHCSEYFLHFAFNLEKQLVFQKKLKKQSIIANAFIEHLAFNLCKYNISEAKYLFNNSLDFEKIKNYFSSFDNLIEIEDKFFLHKANEFTAVEFDIKNNIIEDVD